LLMTRRAPPPTLFPYTTLFRSARQDQDGPLAARILGLDHGVTGAETFALDHGEDALSRHLGDAVGARRDDHHHPIGEGPGQPQGDRKSTRLNSSHVSISYAVFC